MSMSTHVIGIRAADDNWRKMKDARDACRAAGVPIPDAIDEFFGGCEPDDAGATINIDACCTDYNDMNREESGILVDLKKLPKDLTHIRFYNSW